MSIVSAEIGRCEHFYTTLFKWVSDWDSMSTSVNTPLSLLVYSHVRRLETCCLCRIFHITPGRARTYGSSSSSSSGHRDYTVYGLFNMTGTANGRISSVYIIQKFTLKYGSGTGTGTGINGLLSHFCILPGPHKATLNGNQCVLFLPLPL